MPQRPEPTSEIQRAAGGALVLAAVLVGAGFFLIRELAFWANDRKSEFAKR